MSSGNRDLEVQRFFSVRINVRIARLVREPDDERSNETSDDAQCMGEPGELIGRSGGR